MPDRDRRDLYNDVVVELEKKEREHAKYMQLRNKKALKQILENIPKITYKTRWSEAQKLLFKDVDFTQDMDLQNMDKEDALIVFEDHIRQLEKEHEDDIDKQKRWIRRQERKNRESFLCLLDELHEQGKLNSISTWSDSYSSISADQRFDAMLGQIGSTPLDLFKFYVEDLKARYHEEKKIIKEIVKEKQFQVEHTTTFEKFVEVIGSDKRASTLDIGNLKQTYNGLLEKAEAKEKERLKEEQRKQKKLEQNFKNALRKLECTETTKYEEIKEKLENDESYGELKTDENRERVFNEYMHQLQESCLHHVKRKKDKKKKSKHRSASSSPSPAKAVVDGNEANKENATTTTTATNNQQNGDSESAEGEIDDSEEEGVINTNTSNTNNNSSSKHESKSSSSKKHHKKSKKRKKHKNVSLTQMTTTHLN